VKAAMTNPAGHQARSDLRGTFGAWRFLLQTLMIAAFLLVSPGIVGHWPVLLVLDAVLLASVLVTVSANPGWHRLRSVLVVLWLVSVSGTLLSVYSITPQMRQWYRSLELLTSVPLLAVLATGMLAFVQRQRRLTVDSIFATVAAYLLVGLLFAQLYLCLLAWDPGSFTLPGDGAGASNSVLLAEMTYFSLVTLTTVGYGDVIPATHPARMLAVLQAIVGQFYLAVVVAMFVGMYSAQRRG
jgi:hypothetical protein